MIVQFINWCNSSVGSRAVKSLHFDKAFRIRVLMKDSRSSNLHFFAGSFIVDNCHSKFWARLVRCTSLFLDAILKGAGAIFSWITESWTWLYHLSISLFEKKPIAGGLNFSFEQHHRKDNTYSVAILWEDWLKSSSPIGSSITLSEAA